MDFINCWLKSTDGQESKVVQSQAVQSVVHFLVVTKALSIMLLISLQGKVSFQSACGMASQSGSLYSANQAFSLQASASRPL